MASQTVFTTAQGTFIAEVSFQEFATAVQAFRAQVAEDPAQGADMIIPLTDGEVTMVDARMIGQLTSVSKRNKVGFC